MKSGIYNLNFNNKRAYIGKSVDLERRQLEHINKLQKGTHTKKLQEAYSIHGTPSFDVLLYCHEDHIDVYEIAYIINNLDIDLLNTTIPKRPPIEEMAVLLNNMDKAVYSTAEHICMILDADEHMLELEATIRDSNKLYNDLVATGVQTPKATKGIIKELEHGIKLRQATNEGLKLKIQQLNNRNWYERLFNR